MKKTISISILSSMMSCAPALPLPPVPTDVIPSQSFSDSVRAGQIQDFSIYDTSARREAENARARLERVDESANPGADIQISHKERFEGDPRYLQKGLKLKKSMSAPYQKFTSDGDSAGNGHPEPYWQIPRPPSPPPGSSSPYYMGQMRSNPSLWPDEAQGAFLFTDFRALQAMDVVTILVNEASEGKKKAETDAESKFDLLAGITEFFGYETSKWANNNNSLDPTKLIQAKTDVKFEGEGETKRSGTLRAKISAVIMEVLPNGLLRIEGTKIVSLNAEEEIMVVSGLVRPRDIDSSNQVDSSRIANMRIDFYGRGIVTEHQTPGWGARLFEIIWPF